MSYADIEGIEVRRRNRGGGIMSNDVSDGPMRWERARLWAEAHPTSQAAKLYRKRRATAAAVVGALPDHARTSFVFFRDTYAATKRTYLCSLECAVMRVQLDAGARDTAPDLLLGRFKAALAGTRHDIIVLDRAKLERPVKCRVCGEKLLPQADADRLALDDVAARTELQVLTDKYVLLDGKFVQLSTVRVVELGLEQLHLLTQYSTPELRAAYVEHNGYPVSEA